MPACSGAQFVDPYLDEVEEWVERSHGHIHADVAHDKLLTQGYAGSERTTRGAVAAAKKNYRAGWVRVVFSAACDILLPGLDGWRGKGGARAPVTEPVDPEHHSTVETGKDLAAVYRVTGDRHPIHIDPEVARANGFDRTILHVLCTLGIAARTIAEQVGAHPADFTELEVRLAGPVLPGDTIDIRSGERDAAASFEAAVGETTVLRAGRAQFAGH